MFAVAFSLVMFAGFTACPSTTATVVVDPAATAVDRATTNDLEDLYRSGVPFAEFLAAAESRRAAWENHYSEGDVDRSAVDRVIAATGTWRLLVIAEDWCSDSVGTIPFLALLAERAENLELRIVDSEAGSALMEAHPTPDGRGATPTVLLLDEAFENVGCWIERPAELQTWALGARADLDDREFSTRKAAWYEEDAGQSTVDEIVTLIEEAAAGRTICPAG